MDSQNCLEVSDYESFERTMKMYTATKQQINLYFHGRKNDKGLSWCSDCNKSYENIMKARKLFAKPDSIFLEIDVGSQEEYYDAKNKFRQDPILRISVLPTLLQWNGFKRLEDSHFCANINILELFFSDEED